MRIILYTLALALLPMLAQANHIERNLEGFWESRSTHTTIKIDAKRYGFKIKGLYNQRRSVRFNRNRRGQYIDSRGNELIIRSRTRIDFLNRHNGRKTRFARSVLDRAPNRYNRSYYRNNNSSDYYNYTDSDRNSRGYYRDNFAYGSRNEGQSNDRKNDIYYTPIRIDESRLRTLEGTWRNQGSNGKKVIIVSTRDGIKVKDTTSDKWYRYRLSTDRKSLQDDKGNLYQLDNKLLYWTASSGKRIIILEKQSKNTF